MHLWRWITYPFRRDRRRPLSHRQPQRADDGQVPLGMEEIDLSMVESVNRRNASLERVSTFFGNNRRLGSFLEHAETRVTPLADDETYAARYYRAYKQTKGRDI
jgi:hypothetical protein